ncbi:MAG: NAD(P)H-dependent oxidoreductase subunit E [Clostridia bacterium]|nr:NAD(P)H-dependent oxidoreductase subunit E [Clostridia bacterium]
MSNGCECGCGGKDEKLEKIREVIAKCNGDKSQLIHVLNEVQELYGYVPTYVQKVISDEMDIPMAEIYGVITFYSRFSLEAKGKYNISVCLGTACYVKGSQAVLDKVKEILGIDVGGVTADGKFSIEQTRCVGACGLAPVMTVNNDVYGNMDPSKVKDILAKYE